MDKFVNRMGIFKAKLKQIIEREAKGKSKPAIYMEFVTPQGEVTSARLSNPMQKRDYYTVIKFLSSLGKVLTIDQLTKLGQRQTLSALQKYLGEEVMVVVTPFEWNGKTYWSVTDIFNKKFESSEKDSFVGMADDEPGDFNFDNPSADDIGF